MVTNVSRTLRPGGQGDSTSGSNNTRSLDLTGPVFAGQRTTTVSFFGTTMSLFVTFTLHISLVEVLLIKLIKASTFSCLAFRRLELFTLTNSSRKLTTRIFHNFFNDIISRNVVVQSICGDQEGTNMPCSSSEVTSLNKTSIQPS